MKKLILIILIIIPTLVKAQTDQSVDQLPQLNTVAGSEYLYTLDGVTDKYLLTGTLLNIMHDTADACRSDAYDSIAHVAALIGGTFTWLQTGNYLFPNSNSDSVSIGGGTPKARLYVNGNMYIEANKIFHLGGYTYIRSNSGELYLSSSAAGLVSLTQLASGTNFRNGIGITSGYTEWGAEPLIKNTTINGSGYNLTFSALNDFSLSGTGTTISGDDYLTGKSNSLISLTVTDVDPPEDRPLLRLEDGNTVLRNADTILLSNGTKIIPYSTTGIQFNLGSGNNLLYNQAVNPVTRSGNVNLLSNVDGIYFTGASDYLNRFSDDTTGMDTDSASAFSGRAITEYISTHGGGSADISATSDKQVLLNSSGSIAGTDSVTIDGDTLKLHQVVFPAYANTDTLGIWLHNGRLETVPLTDAAAADISGTSDTQVLFNNSGSFGGSSNLTFNGSALSISGATAVTGSGTANRLTFWNGTNTVSSSAYYTVTTAQILKIEGGSGNSPGIQLRNSGGTNAYLQLSATSGVGDWLWLGGSSVDAVKLGGTSTTGTVEVESAKVTINTLLHLTPGSTPGSPSEGDIYSNSSDHHLYFYNGTSWVQLDN